MSYERTKSDWPDETISDQYEWFVERNAPQDAAASKPKRARFSDMSLKQKLQVLYAIVVIGTVGPIFIIFGGLLLLGVWDHFFG